ncbi:LacI family DNA-binding transcriptional regulator [Naasia sp. SYSU D00057]|uniref:LacI family DNA-binding transcriptional regulator n=1 Tax=Naasia sp. SYSU D00057 TaxID=2817380 RepID=UPI0027DDFE74|nr:LacI family DNA-binding transcriptional regulator [Naasia sp. SYSU D00057]
MQEQKRHPTIEDVARTAGVSRAAVSKVLRNAYGVSPAMKERVDAAIEHLHYRPRVAARAMRGSSFTLGIEIPDFGNHFFTRLLGGATRALVGTPYQLIIAPAEGGSQEGYRAIEALADRQVDGIVAISPLVSPEWLERLAERTPLVMLGRHDRSTGYDTVVGDDAAGARLVLDHLLGLGHRRIAHLTRSEDVTVPSSGTPHSIRLAVYLERMRAAGHENQVRVVRTGEGEEAAEAAAAELLRSEPTPTAIFAAHDELAIGALRAVDEAGLDVSVAGYDDIRIAAQPGISLTTVDQSGEEMGERAVRLLLDRIAGRTEPVHEVFAPTLVPRRSTRAPAESVTAGSPAAAAAG